MITRKHALRDAKHLFHLCVVNDAPDENRIRQVVRYLAEAGYRDCPAILANFVRLVRLDRQQHTATIESASALPPELRTDIQASLAHRYGSGLTTAFNQRPSLIGGMRIQVGCNVYDSSVSAKLKALAKNL